MALCAQMGYNAEQIEFSFCSHFYTTQEIQTESNVLTLAVPYFFCERISILLNSLQNPLL